MIFGTTSLDRIGTPIIYGYFYNHLSACTKNVHGVYPTAIGHVFLAKATKA
jgi:peptide/nickel transport system substrate-binding protein